MFMEIAKIVSLRSSCERKFVGAIIVRDNRIISMGYAGAPSGQAHCHPELCDLSKPCTRTIHAEMNAIAYAARSGSRTEGATMYTTLSPCVDCAKAIVSAGIQTLWYLEEYRDLSGIDLLRQNMVIAEKPLVKKS